MKVSKLYQIKVASWAHFWTLLGLSFFGSRGFILVHVIFSIYLLTALRIHGFPLIFHSLLVFRISRRITTFVRSGSHLKTLTIHINSTCGDVHGNFWHDQWAEVLYDQCSAHNNNALLLTLSNL